MNRVIRPLLAAFLFCLLTVTFGLPAWADEDGGPPPAGSVGPGIDVSQDTLNKLKELQTKLKACEGEKAAATTASKDLDAKLKDTDAQLQACLGREAAKAPKPAASAPSRPVKYTCLGVDESGPRQVGNDCTCDNPEYSSVVEEEKYISSKPTKRCVPNRYRAQEAKQIVQQISPICPDPTKLTPEQQAAQPAMCVEFWKLIVEVPVLRSYIDDIIGAYCPVIPERPEATMKERCQVEHDRLARRAHGIGRVNIDFHVDGNVLCRGPGGCGFLPTGSLGIGFYPDPSWRIAPEAEFSAGQFVGGSVNGPITTVGAAGGFRIDLTGDHAFSLHLALQDIQFFSDHEAGSLNGALRTQGMGNALGGSLGLRYDWRFVDLRLRGFVGDGAVNTFPGGNVLADASAIQFGLGLGVGLHVPILE